MKKIILVLGALLSLASTSRAQTTVTGYNIINSNLNSSPVGNVTPSTGAFTSLTTGSETVTGLFTAAGFHGTNSVQGVNPTPSQGSWQFWSTAGLGETDFINFQGGGVGAFNWYNESTNMPTTSDTPLMHLDGAGNLSGLSTIAAAGRVAAGAFHSNNNVETLNPAPTQGAWMFWNTQNLGETDFVTLGGGSGGFNWYNQFNSLPNASSTTLMRVDSSGNLSTGALYVNSATISGAANIGTTLGVAGQLTAGAVQADHASFTTNLSAGGTATFGVVNAASGAIAGAFSAGGTATFGSVNAASGVISGAFQVGNTLTGALFSGPLQGNVTGNVNGSLTGNVTGNVSGNAGTATQLATTPTQCTGGFLSNGIQANGNANCTNSFNGNAATATQFAATPSQCTAGKWVIGISANGTPTCSTMVIQLKSVTATCTTAGSEQKCTLATQNWPVSFVDSSYMAVCSYAGNPTGTATNPGLYALYVTNQTASGFQIIVQAGSNSAGGNNTNPPINCIGIHS